MTPNLLPRTAPRRRPIAFATLAALLFVLPVAAGCSKNSSSEAPAAGSDPVIARVNGVDITQSDLALAEEDVGADMQAASPEAKREHLISYLADIIMVTQAADKKKLADTPEFKRRLAFLRNKLLMGYELQDEAKAALTDDALHQTYNDAVKSMGGQEEVHARHILSRTRTRRRPSSISSRAAPISRPSPRRNPKIRARPRAATSASSPRTRWCRNSPMSLSRCIRGNCRTR